MKIFIYLIVTFYSLSLHSKDLDLYIENVFYEPGLDEVFNAFPGDIIFTKTSGYKSECWVINQSGDNKYCTLRKGTYCKIKRDPDGSISKVLKDNQFQNIYSNRGVGAKDFGGTIGKNSWNRGFKTKNKGNNLKFSCPNFTSFSQIDLVAQESIEKLGSIEKLEFLTVTGNILKFLYTKEMKPKSVEEDNEATLRSNTTTERVLELQFTSDKFLFYKGLVLEVLSYEEGMIEYKVKRPFKNQKT
jgi:hypothetical protein|tara:strand:+ start:249 stop:980 length:732 start_codon:yes stop_codon:yes gene_type:complete